jgi:hypothetical protein
MPFCPNCRTEYVGGATRCADCGADLIGQLPQDRQAAFDLDATRPAEVCQLDNQVQLDLIESQLRAAGIPTVRRPRALALFVPAARLDEAQRVMAGQQPGPPSDSVGLSELHRVRLICSQCDKVTSVDLLTESLPLACSCGHIFELSEARPMLDRYADLVRHMADADFEIELELPRSGE